MAAAIQQLDVLRRGDDAGTSPDRREVTNVASDEQICVGGLCEFKDHVIVGIRRYLEFHFRLDEFGLSRNDVQKSFYVFGRQTELGPVENLAILIP